MRLGEQLDGDAGALALPAAQGADPDVRVWAQSHRLDRVTDRGVDLARGCRRREPEPRGVVERALERQVGVDDVVLRHVSEHAAKRSKVGMDIDAVELHRSGGRRRDARDRLQQRRLAGAARSDDRDELTGGDRERCGIEDRQRISPAASNLPGQVVDIDLNAAGRPVDDRWGHEFGLHRVLLGERTTVRAINVIVRSVVLSCQHVRATEAPRRRRTHARIDRARSRIARDARRARGSLDREPRPRARHEQERHLRPLRIEGRHSNSRRSTKRAASSNAR